MATADTSSMPFWIKFFTDAGIPAGESTNYAVTFTDNRMKSDMLLDLNKEYLNDMGITMMGDVIAILKHAKAVHTQTVREKALKGTNTPVSQSQSPAAAARRSTPASRIVDHYLKTNSDPCAAPMNSSTPLPKVSQDLASRLGPSPAAEKKTSKSSVFERLGQDTSISTSTSESPKVTVTGLSKVIINKTTTSSQQGSSVFNRLGGKKAVKRPATSTVEDDGEEDEPESPLAYAGLFKYPGATKTAKKSVPKKKTALQRLGPEKAEVSTTSDSGTLHSDKLTAEQQSAKKRLGLKQTKPVAAPKVTVSTKPAAAAGKKGVQARLGPQKPEVSSSTAEKIPKKKAETISKTLNQFKRESNPNSGTKETGVFSRLGKKV
ncbi:uncharacterized protein C19orf47 [Lingula anatina]|uniref:Uncharacterized protein C19orf47 n=1 Tax=Lingula anatina TaxID=7574 RepID=A0A1S3J7C2_LINAN|nr:uncharacterized protein C19orf47 [Lingula anatina]|eukprot:XP_013405739.1 uncharacterized protein C19orf47 [Lingula anatina]